MLKRINLLREKKEKYPRIKDMLIGKYYNSLDSQRRVTIPKSLREQLGQNPILTRGLDGGLFFFPQSAWIAIVNNLENQPFTKKKNRDFLRYFSNEAYQVEPDALGRVTVPESLAQQAGLTKDVVIVGSLQYLEVWDRDQYHQYVDELNEQAEALAESVEWGNEYARTSIEK